MSPCDYDDVQGFLCLLGFNSFKTVFFFFCSFPSCGGYAIKLQMNLEVDKKSLLPAFELRSSQASLETEDDVAFRSFRPVSLAEAAATVSWPG